MPESRSASMIFLASPTAILPKPMLISSAEMRRWCRYACMVSYRAIGPEMVMGKNETYSRNVKKFRSDLNLPQAQSMR